jgi:hypothetical protein
MSPGHLSYGETPLDELRQTITFAIWHAADRETGAVHYLPCTHDSCATQPLFDAEEAHRQRHDTEFIKRKHLVALRLAVEVGQDPRPWVVNAKAAAGASWQEIGDVFGVSRQAAQQRFGEHVERVTEGSSYYQSKVTK